MGCQDGSKIGFLQADHIVRGSSPRSAKLLLNSCQLAVIKWGNLEEKLYREGPGHCLISKRVIVVQMSAFNI